MKRSPIIRRTGLKRISSKEQGRLADFNKAKVIVAVRSGGFCEANFSGCTGFAQHFHHRMGRRLPDSNRSWAIVHCCEHCHRYGHSHPIEATKVGFLVSRLGKVSVPRQPHSGTGAPPPAVAGVAAVVPPISPAGSGLRGTEVLGRQT